MKTLKIGVLIFPTHKTIDPALLARTVEERGFESLLVPEHTHIPVSRKTPWPGGAPIPDEYYHTFDPIVLLALAAAATERLQLGTGICLLPQRDTLTTAKSVASLDRLSQGRTIFGVGAGWNEDELVHHGAVFSDRFQRLEEQIQALKGLWTEERFAFQGQHVQFSASYCSPKPVQRPHPPILIGGETDHTLRRIAQYADGWLPRARNGFDAKANMARLKAMCAEVGRDFESVSTSVFGAPNDYDTLRDYQAAGVDRALLALRSSETDDVLKQVDAFTGTLERLT